MFTDTATGRPAESSARARAKALAVFKRFTPRPVNAATVKERRPLLRELARLLSDASTARAFASALSEEGRRPVAACQAEVRRSVQTVQKTEDALVALSEPRALDFSDAVLGAHTGVATRFTYAPLFAIVPFNFPLNLALHKLAPAVALGLPFVCKGPDQNPRAMALLAETLEKAGVPSEDFLVLQASGADTEALLKHVPFPLVSFTGSRAVGLSLRKTFWDRRVILELGSTAAAVLCGDVPRWELERISQGLARSAFGQAGQSCISLQHLFLEPENATDFVSYFKDAAKRIAAKRDPNDTETVCAGLVGAKGFEKAQALVADAAAKGATVWRAGDDDPAAAYMAPTLVMLPEDGAKNAIRLFEEEVFGPVVCVHALPPLAGGDALAQAVSAVDSNIHASIYTYDSGKAKAFFEHATCHSLLWNEAPSWRADAMPYGGTVAVRAAGTLVHAGLVGDEGPLYSIKEYTWERLLVLP